MVVRTIKGKKTPIGKSKPHSGGTITFYDLAQKKKVSVPESGYKMSVNKKGRHSLIAKDAGTKKDGSHYDLYRIIAKPV